MRGSLLRPDPRHWLLAQPYAHRGLHGGGVPENSLAAFAAAIAAGVGIECDVRLCADGVAHVFHDARLDRLTGVTGLFSARTAGDIAGLRLTDGSPIPTLTQLLALVAGKAPLLLEIKSDRSSPARLCRAVADGIAGYRGPVAVMSFDPHVCAWFARHHDRAPRGLVIGRARLSRDRAQERLDIAAAKPHFLARDIRRLPHGRHPLPLLCWTVRTRGQARTVRGRGGQIIFERR